MLFNNHKTHAISVQIFLCVATIVLFSIQRFLEYLNWNFDDALILYRIVNNLLAGHGWVYNLGEVHNASTSVLNTVVLAAVSAVVGDPALSAHILAALWIVFTAVMVWSISVRRIGSTWALILALSVVQLLSTSSIWGLESHLFQFLLVAFISFEYLGLNSWWLLGLLTLTRPDGVVMAGLKWVTSLLTKRSLSVKGVATFLLILLPWAIYSLVHFGQIFPDTLSNKVWQGQSGLWGSGAIYLKALGVHLADATISMKFFYCAGLIGSLKLIQRQDSLLYVVIFAIVQQLAYVMLNVPGYHWYFITLDFCAIVASIGFFELVAHRANLIFSEQVVRLAKGDGLGLILATGALIYAALGISKVVIGIHVDQRDFAYERVINEINARNFPDGPIALLEVGTIGFHSDRKIIDLLGLASANPQYVTDQNLDRFFEVPPQLVVLHDPPWHFEAALSQDLRFGALYRESYSVTTPGYSPMRYYILGSLSSAGIAQATEDYLAKLTIAQPENLDGIPLATSAKCVLDSGFIKPQTTMVNGQASQVLVVKAAGWAVDTAFNEPGQVQIVIQSENSSFVAPAERVTRADVAQYLGQDVYQQAGFRSEAKFQGLEDKPYRLLALIQTSKGQSLCDLNKTVSLGFN